jgi:maleate cis-trans isomerase
MAPVAQAFEQLWPQARLTNLLDDSLSRDLAAAGGITKALTARMVGLARYARDQGAEGILYTCSAFGPAIEAAAADVGIPTLKPNEAMFEEALALCAQVGADARAGLVTTFAPAAESMRAEFGEMARMHTNPACLESACADGAMELLQAGQAQAHDRQVAETAVQLSQTCVLMLGQFSMARALQAVQQATGKPVLTSPASAVRKLQTLLT